MTAPNKPAILVAQAMIDRAARAQAESYAEIMHAGMKMVDEDWQEVAPYLPQLIGAMARRHFVFEAIPGTTDAIVRHSFWVTSGVGQA